MKLNLGCGHRPLEGFVNVDMERNERSKPDVLADLSKPLPFDNGSADEIHAYHVFEHFYRFECEAILDDWVRVLKPGGMIVLEMPCLDSILRIFNHFIEKNEPIRDQFTLWGLYGDPRYKSVPMTHKWCYSKAELRMIAQNAGLSCEFTKPQTHFPIRDMRAECTKAT